MFCLIALKMKGPETRDPHHIQNNYSRMFYRNITDNIFYAILVFNSKYLVIKFGLIGRSLPQYARFSFNNKAS